MRIIKIKFIAVLFLLIVSPFTAYCAEIYLKNGDRISGEIIEQNKDSVSIKTEAMGVVVVRRDFLKPREAPKEEKLKTEGENLGEVSWGRKISLGYNRTSGNTRDSQIIGSIIVSRNRYHVDEIMLKGNAYYSSSKRKMNAQKWYGMGRYAFSFGGTKKWYGFCRLEADHDRFADIDYRLVPAAGIGYWLYDLPAFKLMAEAGAGLEHTDYRSNTKDKQEWVLIPRVFLEKQLFSNSKVTQNLFYYPAFEDFSMYRLRSETTLDIAMNEKLSLRFALIDDYNSDPHKETKNNDLRFTSSLAYSF